MSIRQTSVEAYRTIKRDGLLTRRRFEAYEALYNYGPCTANELQARVLKCEGKRSAEYLMGLDKRLSELRDQGVVSELKSRACSVTRNKCIVWETTNKLPKKILKPTRIKCLSCKGKGYLEQEKLI